MNMDIQTSVFVLMCFVGYVHNVSSLPNSRSRSQRQSETSHPSLALESTMKTSNPNLKMPLEASYPSLKLLQPMGTSERSRIAELATDTSSPSRNARQPIGDSPPGVAYGYATDKDGYKCAYFVPSHRSQYGPRYMLMRCSKGEGADAKFYGCDYKGFPTSCDWYNVPGHAQVYYEGMAKSVASGNSGSCKITWVKMGSCPDVTFTLAKPKD